MMNALEVIAHLAAIATAALASWAWIWFQLSRGGKRKRLEAYLKDEKERGIDNGQRTLVHLMARVGMTEAELVDAAFRSKYIRRTITPDFQGLASQMMLEYDSDNPRDDLPPEMREARRARS